jgi:aromatic-L-amino-acid decarboxylase
MGLPDTFEGVIYDTVSISTLHALAAAREAAVPGVRDHGLPRRGLGQMRIYCSEHAHSSVDRAIILLGLGHRSLRRIAVDNQFRLRADVLGDAIADDRAAGRMCGCTSTPRTPE